MGKFILSVVALFASSYVFASEACAQQLRPVEVQFIEKIKAGKIDEAKEIAELGNINPLNIGGRSVDQYVFGVQAGGQAGFVPWPVLRYIFEDLKISPNSKFQGENRSILSVFCEQPFGFSRNVYTESERRQDLEDNLYGKFKFMIAHGGSGWAYGNVNQIERAQQPIAACLYSLWSQHDPLIRESMTKVVKLLLDNGASVDYDFDRAGNNWGFFHPAFIPAFNYDVSLLNLLHQYGALPAKPISQGGRCSKPPVDVSLLNYLPKPDDREIAAAKAFLVEYISLGGNITYPIFYGNCLELSMTLKEKALTFGQIQYAKMVNDLEKIKVDASSAQISATKEEPQASTPLAPPLKPSSQEQPVSQSPATQSASPQTPPASPQQQQTNIASQPSARPAECSNEALDALSAETKRESDKSMAVMKDDAAHCRQAPATGAAFTSYAKRVLQCRDFVADADKIAAEAFKAANVTGDFIFNKCQNNSGNSGIKRIPTMKPPVQNQRSNTSINLRKGERVEFGNWIAVPYDEDVAYLGNHFVVTNASRATPGKVNWGNRIIVSCINSSPVVMIQTSRRLNASSIIIATGGEGDIDLDIAKSDSNSISLTDKASIWMLKAFAAAERATVADVYMADRSTGQETRFSAKGFRDAFKKGLPRCRI